MADTAVCMYVCMNVCMGLVCWDAAWVKGHIVIQDGENNGELAHGNILTLI